MKGDDEESHVLCTFVIRCQCANVNPLSSIQRPKCARCLSARSIKNGDISNNDIACVKSFRWHKFCTCTLVTRIVVF
jgi:hypothetical protein